MEREYLYPLRLRWWQPLSHSPQVAWLLIKLPLIRRESLLELPAVALKCLSYPCGCHVNQKIPCGWDLANPKDVKACVIDLIV